MGIMSLSRAPFKTVLGQIELGVDLWELAEDDFEADFSKH